MSFMDRRLKALQLAALLCATAALMACGDATSTDADAESAHIEESEQGAGPPLDAPTLAKRAADRKSTRLNSSHVAMPYAVFCLQNKEHGHHGPATSRGTA